MKIQNIKNILLPVIFINILVYFLYHAFQGERGFRAWRKISAEIIVKKDTLQKLQNEKEKLAKKVFLMNPNTLDLDILEEMVKKNLNFLGSNEFVINK